LQQQKRADLGKKKKKKKSVERLLESSWNDQKGRSTKLTKQAGIKGV
jgi:hypothetical protein